MKKLLASLLSVMMVVCFMPAMAWADGETVVAKIGDTTYTSLSAAINAAETVEGGTTIVLQESTTESITIPSDKEITLDLNGKTLTNTANKDTITVTLGGTLTVIGEGKVDNVSHGRGAVFNNGTVVLNGGTYDRTAENGSNDTTSGGNSWYTICNHGTMIINDGVVVQTAGNDNAKGRYSSLVENGYYSYTSTNPRNGYVNGTNAANPSLTINGGIFQGGLNTIKNDDGATVTIENGTFKNFYQAVVQNHNVATINGGSFTAAQNSDKETYGVYNCGCGAGVDLGTLTISSGTFTGADYGVADVSSLQGAQITISGGTFSGEKAAIVRATNSVAAISVSGGTFSDSSASKYLAEGTNMKQDESGAYVADDATSLPAVTDLNAYIIKDKSDYETKLPESYVESYPWVDADSSTYGLPWLVVTYSRNTPEAVTFSVEKDGTSLSLTDGTTSPESINSDAYQMWQIKEHLGVTGSAYGTYALKLSVNGEEFTKNVTYSAPYIPPTTTVQKPVIEPNADVTTSLSADGTTLTIKAKDGYELVDVTVNGVSKGAVTELTGLKTGDKVVITTQKIETPDDDAALIEAVKNFKLVARSVNAKAPSGKKAIKVYWYAKDGSELNFDGYEIYRSTKKNSGYGTKPIYTAKKLQYFNTSAKKGTRYYYKVRGYKEIGGERIYTPYSLKAIRTAK